MSQPRDDLLPIGLLLFRILAFWRKPFTRAKSPDIDARGYVSAPRKIRMNGIVSRRRSVILAVRQIFQQGRELLRRLRSIRHVERRRQAYSVLHWNPGLLHANPILRRRRQFASLAVLSVNKKNQ